MNGKAAAFLMKQAARPVWAKRRAPVVKPGFGQRALGFLGQHKWPLIGAGVLGGAGYGISKLLSGAMSMGQGMQDARQKQLQEAAGPGSVYGQP